MHARTAPSLAMPRPSRGRRFAALLPLAVLLCGCAERAELVPVAGHVLIDGEPLPQGTIQFVPESGRPAVAKIGADGAFRLSSATSSNPAGAAGIKPGKYRIAVSAFEVIDEETEEVRWFAPSQYAQHLSSGLEADVTEPQEDLVLELTWEGAEHESQEASDSDDGEGAAEAAPSEDAESPPNDPPAASPPDAAPDPSTESPPSAGKP